MGMGHHHGLERMERYTIAMMDWHPIHMNKYTLLATLARGHLSFPLGISMSVLSPLELVAPLELGKLL